MENVVIIGSGPAGHTAAIYTGRALLKPLMFEWLMAGGIPAGGQLTTTTDIENFPWFPADISGGELMRRMREQSLKSWTRIETKTVDKVNLSAYPFKIFVWKEEIETKSIIIATWAIAKKLDIPGHYDYWNRWISGCAICDWALPMFRDQNLAIVWGWDVAMEEAMYLTKYASKVFVFVRRDILRASKAMQEEAMKNPKIEFIWNTELIEAKWDWKGLGAINTKNNKTNEEKEYAVAGLFYAIGHNPNTEFLWNQLELDEDGYIITKPGTVETSVKWVFAAGDVQDKKYRQAITSAGTGCMAALEAEKYISTK